MKVRSTNELQSLDDELNLFEDTDWNFMSVANTQASNYEYFNDIRDSDFDKRNLRNFKEQVLPFLMLFAVIVTCIVITIRVTGALDRAEYEQVLGMQSINHTGVVDRVSGSSVDSIAYLKILNNLEGYFGTLKNKDSYSNLDIYVSGSSDFRKTYESATSRVNVLFNKDDCYARAIREFGGMCDLVKINDIIYNNGTYYCYAFIKYPTTLDVKEYAHTYSYSFTKEFTSYLPTEASVVKYLLTLLEDNALNCSSYEICIEFVEDNDNLVIKDDSFVTGICEDAYVSAVDSITGILGSTLTNEDY